MKLQSSFASLFAILLGFSTACYAQKIAVAADKMNVFYLGIDNPLTITAANCPCNRIFVKTTNGTLTGSGCAYTIIPDEVGATYITVFEKKGTKLKELGRNAFRVKMIPVPSFRIGPYRGGMVKKAIVAAQQFVRAELDNFDFEANFTIDSFNVSIIRDSSETKKIRNISNKLSPAISEAFLLLKKNDVIVFDKIFLHPTQLLIPFIGLTYGQDGTPHFNKAAISNGHKISLELDPVTLTVYE